MQLPTIQKAIDFDCDYRLVVVNSRYDSTWACLGHLPFVNTVSSIVDGNFNQYRSFERYLADNQWMPIVSSASLNNNANTSVIGVLAELETRLARVYDGDRVLFDGKWLRRVIDVETLIIENASDLNYASSFDHLVPLPRHIDNVGG